MIKVTIAGAFLGGTLTLLSPCSALLLPAFFAYAFRSKTELAARTGIFLLGLATLLVPLGMGAAFAGSLVLDYRTESIWVIGSLLIIFGGLELAGMGFSLLPRRLGQTRPHGGWGSAYMTGLVYGFAGFCSGPLLGAVLTVAAGAGHPLYGGLLLLAYATGMAVPLFFLAALWDRFNLGARRWLRGVTLRVGPLHIHTTNAMSGGLFILLGVLFITSGGTVAFERFYESRGLLQLSMHLQQWLSAVSMAVPDWVWLLAAAAIGVTVGLHRHRDGS